MKEQKIRHLATSLLDTFQRHCERPAMDVSGKCYTWGETATYSEAVASALREAEGGYVALFGYRTLEAYTGMFGIILSGKAYTPLNPRFPAERNRKMVEASGALEMVLAPECVESFRSFAGSIRPLKVICHGEMNQFEGLIEEFPNHTFLFTEPLLGEPWSLPDAGMQPDSEKPVYLLFTSGTTGDPKGISVSGKNLKFYLNYTLNRYGINEFDRMSQMFDLTFDLSVHDIFLAATSGACLCVVPERSLMGPAKFIREKELTLWFSVPAVVMFMSKMRMLKADAFPSLRYSLFCGEALPAKSTELWQKAAPNSILENLYGPTEATIAFTNYRWNSDRSPEESIHGVVPIGTAFEGLRTAILKENGSLAGMDEPGELLLGGEQVTDGYFRNRALTEEKFITLEENNRWYRTGDLVQMDASGCLFYLGRIDDQIQVRGHRVELQEIDQVLREASGRELAISVPVTGESGSVESIAGFVEGIESDRMKKEILSHCRNSLADYMVPSDIRFIDTFPLNSNGKIDRKELTKRFKHRSEAK